MKTLSKMLENYAEVNRKIGFYGYDGDAFSSKKIKNLEEQAEKQSNLSVGDTVNVEIFCKQELDNDNKMNLRSGSSPRYGSSSSDPTYRDWETDRKSVV